MKSMKIKENEIYSIKLMGGEELIARVISQDEKYFYLKAPLGVMMTNNGLQLIPALFTSVENPEEVAVLITAVAMISETRDDVKEAYEKSISPIVQPNKQILTG